MQDKNKITSSGYFTETSFSSLMQNRIQTVLLICSSYDAFLLEEDGRIEEQIFNEYVSLNLRYPPRFIQVTTAEKAFEKLKDEPIDLVVSMLSIGGMDPFSLTKSIKKIHSTVPIVVLTPFSREVTLNLSREDTSAIDYIFCWLGNADLLLAIIKLIEDEMNADNDVIDIGVQCIILVEDSVRFYSSYLPTIYKIIFNQSKKFMTEGLNEHQKMLRMRGRPKILLARSYEEALNLYTRYKSNVLGIISDVSFGKDGEKFEYAGVLLAKKVKEEDPNLPFLLQSSDKKMGEIAKEIKVGFIHKYANNLLHELKQFLKVYLAFGDFVFVDPNTLKEVERVNNLKCLQEKLFTIPDESLYYHFKRNHVSKWLNARALFPIARVLKELKIEDFDSISETKQFLYDTIINYRISKAKGVIAKFYLDRYDSLVKFARVGNGSIGGKARGLAFLNNMINKNSKALDFDNIDVTIPHTVVIGTDVFEYFMEHNNLYEIALSDISDEEILEHFVAAKLPVTSSRFIKKFISVIKNPIAIRSSSVLEDSHYQPFAGIYSTYMVSNTDSEEVVMQQISEAIKCVYASVYFKSSKAYMEATMNIIDEEKMGVVLQEVVGQLHGDHFYPTISGVARSVNFYPIAPEQASDGIVNVALGLGKQIVEGGVSLRFSPRYPQKALQLSAPELTIRETQKKFFALDMSQDSFVPSTDDAMNLLHLDIKTAKADGTLRWLGSVYDYQNNIIKDGTHAKGIPLITFSNILKHDVFPLANILDEVLKMGQREMNQPVEIEFAVDLQSKDKKPSFYLLQIRPIVDENESFKEKLEACNINDELLYSTSALGNGLIDDVQDVVYIKSATFDAARTVEMLSLIENVNKTFSKKDENYLLVGPGRWGSQDSWLGIPVTWPQISCARVIVETSIEGFAVDPSQGTHFFQNLTSLRVGYLTVSRQNEKERFDEEFLNNLDAVYEDEFIRHVRFNAPLSIRIDGKKGLAAISYPKKKIVE